MFQHYALSSYALTCALLKRLLLDHSIRRTVSRRMHTSEERFYTPPPGCGFWDCDCTMIETKASIHHPLWVVMVVVVYRIGLPNTLNVQSSRSESFFADRSFWSRLYYGKAELWLSPLFKMLQFDILAKFRWTSGEILAKSVEFWWQFSEIMMKFWQNSGRECLKKKPQKAITQPSHRLYAC